MAIEKLFSKKEVADLLGLTVAALNLKVFRREFPAPSYLGRRAVWPESIVKAWIEANLTPPADLPEEDRRAFFVPFQRLTESPTQEEGEDLRAKISRRTKAALAVRKAQGVKLGRAKGVDTSKACAAAVEAKRAGAEVWAKSVLPAVLRCREGGASLGETARRLNGLGIPTRKGAEWTATTVRRVLAYGETLKTPEPTDAGKEDGNDL